MLPRRPAFAAQPQERGPMASTLYEPDLASAGLRAQRIWPVFVGREGALLFDPRAYSLVDPDEVLRRFSRSSRAATATEGLVMLPACREQDMLLDQPMLGLRLSP